MESTQTIPYRGISFFFIFILALITWGFYKTYIIFFPSFTGFNNVQHFHGAMMMTWMVFLIVQPLLIRSGKVTIHRAIGKLSYVIAPLLIVSIFLASRMVYQRSEPVLPHEEKIAGTNLNRQRATVKTALERLDFESDAVVINAVSAVNTRAQVRRRIIKADARREVVRVFSSRAVQERKNQRIQLVCATDVFDVGIELIAQPKIQS